ARSPSVLAPFVAMPFARSSVLVPRRGGFIQLIQNSFTSWSSSLQFTDDLFAKLNNRFRGICASTARLYTCASFREAAFKAQAGFDYTEGILRLQASTLFEYPKLVVWKHVDKVVYTLICEPLDNPLLASNFLTLFVHELSDHFRKAGNMVEEVSSRPDEIFTILNLMLPGGQLLFTNSNLHRHFKAQISQVLSQK
ncbi:unnamed protein product, partial [Durusdinium trenchii]